MTDATTPELQTWRVWFSDGSCCDIAAVSGAHALTIAAQVHRLRNDGIGGAGRTAIALRAEEAPNEV